MAVWTVDSRAAAMAVMWVAAKAETKVGVKEDLKVELWAVWKDSLMVELMVGLSAEWTAGRSVETSVSLKAAWKVARWAVPWADMWVVEWAVE